MATASSLAILCTAIQVLACSSATPPSAPPYDVAAVERDLRAADLAPTREETTVQHPFMHVPGTVLRVDGADVQVFVYANERARRADTAKLDPTRVAPPTMSILWIMRPSLLSIRNTALILLTNDDALRSRITSALPVR